MAWEARLGLKPPSLLFTVSTAPRLNGLGSPFGFETQRRLQMGTKPTRGLNGLGSPFGFETGVITSVRNSSYDWLNGLGSPFGFETGYKNALDDVTNRAKWPGKPVWV